MNPQFLTLDEVMEIHRDQIERYGGTLGVRDAALLAGCGKILWTRQQFMGLYAWDNKCTPRRMLKKTVQQGRSEQRGEAYASVR